MLADTDSVAPQSQAGCPVLLHLPSWLQGAATVPDIMFGFKPGKGYTNLAKAFPKEPGRALLMLYWPELFHMATLSCKEVSRNLAISGSTEEAEKEDEYWKVGNDVRLAFSHPVCLRNTYLTFKTHVPLNISF